ncbi:MAG: right-handed parallel beta-helix repeat-containing protein [Sedimentisphaerales bacterium]
MIDKNTPAKQGIIPRHPPSQGYGGQAGPGVNLIDGKEIKMRRYILSLAIIISFQSIVLPDVLVVKSNSSIQQAVDKAESGQTVSIEKGEYHENLVITRPITLKADDNQAVTIRASTCQKPLIDINNCSGVSIIGLNLDGMNENSCDNLKNSKPAINIAKSSVRIANCRIINAFGCGILIWPQSECNIVNAECLNNLSSGIYAYGESINLKVQNCKCAKNQINGIYILKGAFAELKNNDCLNNAYNGISVSECPNNVNLENNKCSNNSTGIYIGEGSKCRATANNLQNNYYQGIIVTGDGTDVMLEKNNCTENGKNGIYLEKNCFATIKENICSKNLWNGIAIDDGIKYANLYANQIIENKRQGVWLVNSGALITPDNIIKNNGEISRWYLGKIFRMEKFQELEEIAEQLRKENKRYSNGSWQIQDYYYAVAAAQYNTDEAANVSEIEGHINEWLKQYPNSITPRIMLAKAYINLAWRARGSGWISEVTEQGLKDMEKYNALAVEQVKKTLALNIDEPEIYDIYQVLSLNVEEFRKNSEEMFKKATAIYPDYWPLYIDRAYLLMPRWHGRKGDLVKLADSFAAQDPNYEIYALIADSVVWPGYDKVPDDILDIGFSYQKIKTGLESLIKKWPENDGFKRSLCVYACVFIDKETAKKLFNELGESRFNNWQNNDYTAKLRKWANSEGEYPLFAKELSSAEIKKNELQEKLRQTKSRTILIITSCLTLVAIVICISLFAALNIKAGRLRYAALVPLLIAFAALIYAMADNFHNAEKWVLIIFTLFISWNMLPIVLWAIVTLIVNKNIKIARTLMLNNIILSAFIIFVILDAMYVSLSSTSSLIFIFLPIYCIVGSLITFAVIHTIQILIVKSISPGKNQ